MLRKRLKGVETGKAGQEVKGQEKSQEKSQEK